MPGPGFVRSKRPGAGGIGVVGLHPAAVVILFQLGDDEDGIFAGVADERRRIQVRRRLHRGLRSRGNPDAGIAFRQRQEVFAHDDLFEIPEHVVIMVE